MVKVRGSDIHTYTVDTKVSPAMIVGENHDHIRFPVFGFFTAVANDGRGDKQYYDPFSLHDDALHDLNGIQMQNNINLK